MRFYALMVKSLCEGVAKRDLERMGFEAVAPILVKKRHPNGPYKGAVERREPLFRGYVFVRLPTLVVDNRMMPLRAGEASSAKGALHFVSFGMERTPVPVAQGFVEIIIDAMDKSGHVSAAALAPPTAKGQTNTIDPLRARIAARMPTRVLLRNLESSFSGLEGDVDYSDVAKLIASLDARNRVRILMRLMNAVVPVEVDRNEVEIVQPLNLDVRARGSSPAPTRTKVQRTA